MIRLLDNFFDKYEKRVIFIEILLMSSLIVLCSRNYILGINLIHFDQGIDLFSLIELKETTDTFFGRFLESVLNSDLSVYSIIRIFFKSFSFFEISWITLAVCFLFERDKNQIVQGARRSVLIFSTLYLIQCFIVVFLGNAAYSALSTMQAVQRLNQIGMLLSIGSILLILLMLIVSTLQIIQVFSKHV